MSYRSQYIELFGERLLLHERSIKDAQDHNEFAESITTWDFTSELYFNVLILRKALKANLNQLPYLALGGKRFPLRVFKFRKLSRILSEEYIYKNLGVGTLRSLVDKIRFDLEMLPRNNESTEKISRANLTQLVARYSNMTWDEVEKLSVSEFNIRLEQSINMMNAETSGKFGIKSRADELRDAEDAYNHFFSNNMVN